MDENTKRLLNHAFKEILAKEVNYVAERVANQFEEFIKLSGLKVPIRVETRLDAEWFDLTGEPKAGKVKK